MRKPLPAAPQPLPLLIMKTQTLPLRRIGRSQAVCLPAALIRKHHFTAGLILEDRGYEIVLRSKDSPKKLSWTETYREMTTAKEDWSDWDGPLVDGLDETSEWAGLPPPKLSKSRRARK